MRSMLAPWAAIRAVTAATALASRGAPRTTTAARPLRRGALSPVPARNLTFMPEPRGDVADDRPQPVVAAPAASSIASGQMPSYDDLLEVQDLGADVGDGVEQRRW